MSIMITIIFIKIIILGIFIKIEVITRRKGNVHAKVGNKHEKTASVERPKAWNIRKNYGIILNWFSVYIANITVGIVVETRKLCGTLVPQVKTRGEDRAITINTQWWKNSGW